MNSSIPPWASPFFPQVLLPRDSPHPTHLCNNSKCFFRGKSCSQVQKFLQGYLFSKNSTSNRSVTGYQLKCHMIQTITLLQSTTPKKAFKIDRLICISICILHHKRNTNSLKFIFLPNSLTIPSPIPFDPPVTIVTFPAYLRFDVSAPVAIFFNCRSGQIRKILSISVPSR